MGDCIVPNNMVLLGNEGHGKSSFGNFILDRRTFAVSGAGVAPNRKLCYGAGNRGSFTMKVVEMPACADGRNDQLQAYREMLRKAYEICDHNLHIFWLVIKFDGANTGKCLQIFDKWREILGADIFARRGVVVITFGDEFTRLMEKNNTPDKKFSEWCCEQGGDLRNLLEECNPRRILFYNNARTEDTFVELSNYMRLLSYTDNKFSKEFTKRQKSTNHQKDSIFWVASGFFFGVVVVGVSIALGVVKVVAKRGKE